MSNEFPSVDKLIELGKRDPEALERLRLEHVESLIAQAPPRLQRRLRGLQFKIDCKRQLHSSPMGACVEISHMMMQSMERLHAALHGTLDDSEAVDSRGPAQVIALDGRPSLGRC